jgi:hypothetical protein
MLVFIKVMNSLPVSSSHSTKEEEEEKKVLIFKTTLKSEIGMYYSLCLKIDNVMIFWVVPK